MEKKLSALIVDDEESARKLLKALLQETLYFNEIRTSSSAASAQIELSDFEPDIIFLDIKMPGRDGFSFLEDIKNEAHKSEIVFVTAYDQYAIKAIKNQAFDYLLKPVSRKELKQCIERFNERKKENLLNENSIKVIQKEEGLTRIRVNTRTGTVFINPSSILYCKADGNYTVICTGEKQHLCSINLGKVAEMLPGKTFIRLGRSHIINFEFITLVDRRESTVTLNRNGESATIKVPRQHLKDLDIF
jgi:two-component system LytT family response regulator